jgi:hypothetical protein
MGSFKEATTIITDWFENNAVIKDVTLGDIGEVDLSVHTDFPLAHVIYDTTQYNEGYTALTYQIMLLDKFVSGEDDKLDIIDRMNTVATEFMNSIYQGTVFSRRVHVNSVPTSQIVYDQLENRLYGISLQIDVKVPPGIVICA